MAAIIDFLASGRETRCGSDNLSSFGVFWTTAGTAAYWNDEASARAWKGVAEHREAQALGRERWYAAYRVRVAVVGRDYGMGDA